MLHDERVLVVKNFKAKLDALQVTLEVLAVSGDHLHMLGKLPRNPNDCRSQVGKAKQFASHQIRASRPGPLWVAGGKYDPIRDRGHWLNTARYVGFKQEAGTAAWARKLGLYRMLNRCGGIERIGAVDED